MSVVPPKTINYSPKSNFFSKAKPSSIEEGFINQLIQIIYTMKTVY